MVIISVPNQQTLGHFYRKLILYNKTVRISSPKRLPLGLDEVGTSGNNLVGGVPPKPPRSDLVFRRNNNNVERAKGEEEEEGGMPTRKTKSFCETSTITAAAAKHNWETPPDLVC